MIWQDRNKISGQTIAQSLLSLAIPAALSTFFTVIFEVIDMYWIGKLGAVSTAAMASASFFIWMLRGLGLTVAAGTIALVARRTGEKDEVGLMKTISHAIGTAFVFSVLIMIVFFPLALHIFHWVKLEPSVGALAEEYIIIFLSGLIFVYLMATIEFVIRGIGDTRTPMIIMGVSLMLNVVLAPLFIFILGFGMKGAAYATISSQAVGTVLMAIVLFKKVPALRKVPASIFFSFKAFSRQFLTVIKIGGPVGLNDAGFSFIYLLLSGIISIFGKEPLAAIGIAHRLEGFPFFICLGFAMAVEPIVGQCLGAGEIDKARKTVYLALKITTVLMAAIFVIYFIFAPFLFRILNSDPGIIRNGIVYLRIVTFFDIFLASEVVLTGAFSGAGDTKPPFFITFPITFMRIPLSYLFAVVFKLGTPAIWLLIGLTTLLKGTLLFYVFQKGNWAKKKV